MTERDLLIVVAAAISASPAYQMRVAEADSPKHWDRVVQDAEDLLVAVDARLASRKRPKTNLR